MESEKNFLLPESIKIPLLEYLARRPYNEVYQVVDAIQRLQVVNIEEEKEKRK